MTPNREAFHDVVGIIETYFEGLHQADSTILSDVFHAKAHYINATAGDDMNYDMPTYFDIVDRRTSPADLNEELEGRILSIAFGNDRMAFVVARSTMFRRDYLDFLTLTLVDGSWKIIAKVFTSTPKNEAA